jgi:hypothetical protein
VLHPPLSADVCVCVRLRACVRVRACACACPVPRAPSPPSALTAASRRSENQIGSDGAAVIADSLQGLTALKELYL